MVSLTELPNNSVSTGSASPSYSASSSNMEALGSVVKSLGDITDVFAKKKAEGDFHDVASSLNAIHEDTSLNVMEKNKRLNQLQRQAQASLPSDYLPKVNSLFSGQHLRQQATMNGSLITDEAGNPIGEQQLPPPEQIMAEDFQNQLLHVGAAFPNSGQYALEVQNRVGFEPHEFQTHTATLFAIDQAAQARMQALPQQMHGYDMKTQQDILKNFTSQAKGDMGQINNLFVNPTVFAAIKAGKISTEEVYLASEGMLNEYISHQPSNIDLGELYTAKNTYLEQLRKTLEKAPDLDNMAMARHSEAIRLRAEDNKNLDDLANGNQRRELASAVNVADATYKGAVIFNENFAKMNDPSASTEQIQQAATIADIGAGLVGKASGVQFASAQKMNFNRMSGVAKTVDMALQQPKITNSVVDHIINDMAPILSSPVTVAINQEEVAGFMNDKLFPLIEKAMKDDPVRYNPSWALKKLSQFEQTYQLSSALRAKHPEWTKEDGQRLKAEIGAPASTWHPIDATVDMLKSWKKKFIDMGKPPVDQTGASQTPKSKGGLSSLIISDANAAEAVTPMIPGNIDLNKRPIVHNSDGSYSTVRSISFEEFGHTVLIPTVIENKVVSDKEAIDHFHKTGEHLGFFNTPQEADLYAKHLHDGQAKLYDKRAGVTPINAINKAASATGNDPAFMQKVAQRESQVGTAPDTGSAKGLFQIMPDTWSRLVAKHGAAEGLTKGGVSDPVQNAKGAALLLNENKDMLTKFLGREPNNVELYLAHFLGSGDVRTFLKHLHTDRKVDKIVPKATHANPNILKGKTPMQVYMELAQEFPG